MRVLIGVIRVLLTAALCAVILLSGWTMVQEKVMEREAPEFFGCSRYFVESDGMEPTLPVGAMILVKEQEAYEPGDIVVFRSENAAMPERIVGTVSGQFIIRGDAGSTEDEELLAPENILGKVCGLVGSTRETAVAMGKLWRFFCTPAGILTLLLAGVLIVKLPNWLGGPRAGAPRGRHAQ